MIFETYFCIVSQTPVENSVVNLVSPIIINEKDKIIGQYVTSEKQTIICIYKRVF